MEPPYIINLSPTYVLLLVEEDTEGHFHYLIFSIQGLQF